MGAAGSGTFAISPETPGESRGPKVGEKRGVKVETKPGVRAEEDDGRTREVGTVFKLIGMDILGMLRLDMEGIVRCIEVGEDKG